MMSFGARCRRTLAAAVLMAATAGVALAGMEVSLEREYMRLRSIEDRVRSLPDFQRSEELEKQISDLRRQIEQLASSPSNPAKKHIDQRMGSRSSSAEAERLKEQIRSLDIQLRAAQKTIANFREAIGDGPREKFFPGVRNRVAAFTFDDPHGTGLGDAISFLLAKKLLFSTRVSSFAIVNYRQGMDRDIPRDLTYFDRVDAITKDQNFPLAMWGRLSRTERGVRIDSFLQVPGDADKGVYVRSLRLPEAMGSGTLTTRLKPDRILLQSLEVDAEGTTLLRGAAKQVATLRASPAASAAVTGHLGEAGDQRTHTIIGSERDWVHLRLSDGSSGWTSVDQFCTGVCASLLDVARFANDIVAIPVGLAARPIAKSLTREADAMSQQLTGLVALLPNPNTAAETAERWARGDTAGKAPGGAGFANLLAVARVNAELKRAGSSTPNFDRIKLNKATIERIVQPLAEASIADPSDVDVVENLAVLFAYLGDEKRRKLAMEIASSLKAKMR